MENPYAAPRGQILTPVGNQAPLTWKQILFSFDGRIPRRTYWGMTFLTGAISNIATVAIEHSLDELTGAIATLIVVLPFMWVFLAIAAKRWHDRDKSAWWILFAFVPIIGWIWSFVECGCLRGTIGPNQYGGDPT